MYYDYEDERYEWSEANHHPTCRCGCGELADECMGPRWQKFLAAQKKAQESSQEEKS